MAAPPVYTTFQSGKTTLSILLASSNVIMEKEEEAFSFESLVSDVGGVLGLFIGFNFLVIWEIIINFIEKFA